MTSRLVEDPDGVAALAGQVADRTGLPATHVEKDFWVTEVLRGVARTAEELGVEVLFKGGTSLSKAFGIIERFSEDVDVLVVLPEGGTGKKDSILKRLVDGASVATGLGAQVDPATATKGVKRTARFVYREGRGAGDGLAEGVLLEIGSRGGALGAAFDHVRSLLAVHAGAELADAVEAEPVRVRVMAPWRTLVEKLVLLHTAHCAETPEAAIRAARHYYDVHQLLGRTEVLSGVAEVGVGALARDVCTYSREAGLPAEARPGDGFATSPAFSSGPHVNAARSEYEGRVLGQLLWPGAERPPFDSCIEAVHLHRDEL